MMIGVGIRSSGTEEREGEGDGDLEVVARNALESPEYKAGEREGGGPRWSKWEFVR